MHRVVTFEVGGRRLHLLKVIGFFISLGAVIMIFSEAFHLTFIASAISNPGNYSVNIASINVALQDADLNTRSGLFLGPVAGILFWAAILVVGLIVFRSSKLVLPVDEYFKSGKLKSKH